MKLKPQSPLPSQLPRYRTALHDAYNLTAELALYDRPPWDKRELKGLLDHGKLAADGLAISGGAEPQRLARGQLRADAGNLALAQRGEKIAPVED